ncbi:unnamed protein product [Amoebophrya sp. A120]|nr:unnamed protein product [Amoebophrya sp. A120]|eukprot:GSA120T00009791001.1
MYHRGGGGAGGPGAATSPENYTGALPDGKFNLQAGGSHSSSYDPDKNSSRHNCSRAPDVELGSGQYRDPESGDIVYSQSPLWKDKENHLQSSTSSYFQLNSRTGSRQHLILQFRQTTVKALATFRACPELFLTVSLFCISATIYIYVYCLSSSSTSSGSSLFFADADDYMGIEAEYERTNRRITAGAAASTSAQEINLEDELPTKRTSMTALPTTNIDPAEAGITPMDPKKFSTLSTTSSATPVVLPTSRKARKVTDSFLSESSKKNHAERLAKFGQYVKRKNASSTTSSKTTKDTTKITPPPQAAAPSTKIDGRILNEDKVKSAEQVILTLPMTIQEKTAFELAIEISDYMQTNFEDENEEPKPAEEAKEAAKTADDKATAAATASSTKEQPDEIKSGKKSAADQVDSANTAGSSFRMSAILPQQLSQIMISKLNMGSTSVNNGRDFEQELVISLSKQQVDQDLDGRIDLIELTDLFKTTHVPKEKNKDGSEHFNYDCGMLDIFDKLSRGESGGLIAAEVVDGAYEMLYGLARDHSHDPPTQTQQYCPDGQNSVYVCDAGNKSGKFNDFLTTDFQHEDNPGAEPLEMDQSLCKLYNFAFSSNIKQATAEQVKQVGQACEGLMSTSGQNCCHWVPEDKEKNACRPYYRCLQPAPKEPEQVEKEKEAAAPAASKTSSSWFSSSQDADDKKSAQPAQYQEVYEDDTLGDIGPLSHFYQPVKVDTILPPFGYKQGEKKFNVNGVSGSGNPDDKLPGDL